MKISGRKPVGRATSAKAPARSVDSPKIDAGAKLDSPASEVELSSSMQEIESAKEAFAGISDIRVEKVEEIKPRVEDGSYKVESQVVAKKMVDSAIRESASESGSPRA